MAGDRTDRLHRRESLAKRNHRVGIRVLVEDPLDLRERVARPFEDDRPATLRVLVGENPEPGEQQDRLIGLEELDAALVGDRNAELVGRSLQLPSEASRPGEDRDVIVAWRAKVAVLVVDRVGVVADDRLDPIENRLVFARARERRDRRVLPISRRLEPVDFVDGSLDRLATRRRHRQRVPGEVQNRLRRAVVPS